MIRDSRKRLLLQPRDVPADRPDWEVIGAFNPAAAVVGDEVVLFVRIVERPREVRPGYVPLSSWKAGVGPVADWIPESEVEFIDPRIVRIKSTGLIRLTFVSHLRVVYCGSDGLEVRRFGASFVPEDRRLECFGVEDPRVTLIDGTYWITYVAVSTHGVSTSLASTRDFLKFDRHGIIFPPDNKDVLLFPEKIRGRYAALHRPHGAAGFSRPEMWIAWSEDLLHWGGHQPLFGGKGEWESGRVGGGVPPIRTERGWLELYHGNRRPQKPGDVGEYQGSAMMLDLDDPARVLLKSDTPFMRPTESFEMNGFVSNVVFPTGVVERNGSMLVYYGAGDACTAVWETTRAEIETGMTPVV